MIKKEDLIKQVHRAFRDVKLEDGIGLWEAQGLDDRLSSKECKELRRKDQKEDWMKIPLLHLYQCSSSLSFFDGKGMRFHFPVFMLIELGVFIKEEDELEKEQLLKGCIAPDIQCELLNITDYLSDKKSERYSYGEHYKNLFSLFNIEQLDCIVKYIQYQMEMLEEYYKSDKAKDYGLIPESVTYDKEYQKLQEVMKCWLNEFPVN